MRLERSEDWLDVDLGGEHELLSWAFVGGGRRRARRVSWRQVRRGDLPADVDARAWIDARVAEHPGAGEVLLLTSRDLRAVETARARVGAVEVEVVATVGLSNALRAGDPVGRPPGLAPETGPEAGPDRDARPSVGAAPADGPGTGTINLLVRVDRPLTEEAALEALALAVEARTLAVVEHGLPSCMGAGRASGTGTDCLALAWPAAGPGGEPVAPLAFAGKHTELGSALGAAVLEAVARGVRAWRAEGRRVFGESVTDGGSIHE